MAALTVQQVVRSGLNPTYSAAAAGGDTAANDGKKVFIHVKNGGASAITVTIATPGTVDGLAITDREVSVPASEERMIGPFPIEYYSSTLDLTYSDVTSVTIGAFKVP